MGLRSFLIAFTDTEQIKKFFQWRHKIACIIADFAMLKEKVGENIHQWSPSHKSDSLNTLVEFAVNYSTAYKSQYESGDYDLDLIGLTYWKGMIWGLISTWTVGEDVFDNLMTYVLPDNFWTRTSYLPKEYEVQTTPIFLRKDNDQTECLEIFQGFPNSYHWKKIRSEHPDLSMKLINYDSIWKSDYEDDDDYIPLGRDVNFRDTEDTLIQLINKELHRDQSTQSPLSI